MDDVGFRMGLDTSAVGRALRSLDAQVSSAGKKMVASFTSAVSKFGGAFSAIGAIGMANKISNITDQLEKNAKGWGVSTDFLQGFGFAASQSGSDADTAQKGIGKMAEKIGEALEGSEEAAASFAKYGISMNNAEDATKDLADVLANTEDGSRRVAIAAEFMGAKVGKELIAALQGGRAELERFTEAADKFSQKDIETINAVKDTFGALGNKAMVAFGSTFGKVVSFFRDPYAEEGISGILKAPTKGIFSLFGAKFADKGPTAQMNEMIALSDKLRTKAAAPVAVAETEAQMKKRVKLAADAAKIEADTAALERKENFERMDDEGDLGALYNEQALIKRRTTKDEVEAATKKNDLAKKSAEINEKIAEIEKTKAQRMKEQEESAKRLAEVRANLLNMEMELQTTKADRSKLTVAEWAGLDIGGQSRANQGKIRTARQIEELEFWGNQFAGVNEPRSQLNFKAADKLRKGFEGATSQEQNPFASMEKSIEGLRTDIKSGEAKFQAIGSK